MNISRVELVKSLGKVFKNKNRKIVEYTINGKSFCVIKRTTYPYSVDVILYIETNKKIKTKEAREILGVMELLGKEHTCYNYKLISINGYEDNHVYELENFNMCIEEREYIDYILGNLDKNETYIDLMAHNRVTYRNIKKIMNSNDRVCAIQATGTGKSYLAGRCALDYKNDNKIILSSSYYILGQFVKTFDFLKENTRFIHYAQLSSYDDEAFNELDNYNPELIILDEFHRAGASEWQKGVERLLSMFPNAKKLGTTATPIRYLDNKRDMSREIFRGNVANEIHLFDALIKKLLPMPRYVQAFYEVDSEIEKTVERISRSGNSKKEKLKFNEMTEMLAEAFNADFNASEILKKHINNQRNFVIFCKSYEHINEMIPIVKEWFKNAFLDSKIEIFKISSNYSNSDKEFEAFTKSIPGVTDNPFKLLFTIDMMNEGVHAPATEALIFLRPTTSPIIYFQQMGRCLQANSDKQPIIFDFVSNSNNIQTIAFKEGLKSSFDTQNRDRKDRGLNDLNSVELEELCGYIYDETKDILGILKEINSSLMTTWDEMYEQLREFYIREGHTRVYSTDEYKKLLSWIKNQRVSYSNNTLKEDRIEKLNKIEFTWNVMEQLWVEKYEELKEYYKIHGHSDVQRSSENSSLYNWVLSQRTAKRKNELDKDKVKLLNNLNLSWEIVDKNWADNLALLRDYYKNTGKVSVAKDYNKKLYYWERTQRDEFRKGVLSDNKISGLNDIGFIWDPLEYSWNVEYNKLLEYKEMHGNIDIPYNDEEYRLLYKWIIAQRGFYNKGTMSKIRVDKLNEIDFVWDALRAKWNEGYSQLKKYYKEYGDTLVPQSQEYKKLNTWAQKQRNEFRAGILTEEKICLLNELNFAWDSQRERWLENYKQLINFKNENNHLFVPSSGKYTRLCGWANQQRRSYNIKKLDDWKIEKLNEIDFPWDKTMVQWEDRYKEVSFVLNNPCEVLNKQLKTWVVTQRVEHKKGKLSDYKISKLTEIGIIY